MARHIERRRKLRPVYPAPELVIEESIDIAEGGGSMEISVAGRKRMMRVPLADTPRARHIRAHETAHAKYSPADPRIPEDMPNVAMQRAEDMRMNYYCRACGLDEAMDAVMVDDVIIEDLVREPMRYGRLLPAVTAASATFNTGDWPLVIRAIVEVDPTVGNLVAAFIPSLWKYLADKGEPSWDDAMRNAWELVKFCESPESHSDPEPGESGESSKAPASGSGSPEPSGEDEGETSGGAEPGSPSVSDEPPSGESSSETSTEGTEPGSEPEAPKEDAGETEKPTKLIDLSDDPLDKSIDRRASDDEREAEVAADHSDDPVEGPVKAMLKRMQYYPSNIRVIDKMTIHKRPLKERLAPSKLKGRTKIAHDYGRVPRYMGRYCSDRSIFEGAGKRRGGGAILIDASGSMHLGDENIDQILSEAPAATIATYAGRGKEGQLWIIAANGKRVPMGDSLRPPMLGNVVDVPALRWLSKQRGDKYWICDGVVTGQNDAMGENIAEICADICRRNHIMRVHTIEQFVKLIESL